MLIKHSAVAGAILFAASQTAGAVTINFDYTYDGGFFSGTNLSHRSTLEAAGSFIGNLLTDNLTSIASGGVNQFNAQFTRPDTGNPFSLTSFNEPSNTLTVFVGGRVLGGNTLGEGGPGGYSISGTLDFVTTAKQRGQTGLTTGPTATDFAPWGGQIAFDNATNWYFDSNTSTTESFSGNDFYSVALHELAHVLGFGTADSWKILIAGNIPAGNSFTGANSKIAYGGNVPLSSDLGHWQEGTLSSVAGTSQEALMDPSITTGTRKVFTTLDLAGLKDVGWQVAAVPIPSAVWLFGSALLGFAGYSRRKI